MIKKTKYFLFAKISIIGLKILITSVDFMVKLALLIKIFFMAGFMYLILDFRFLGLTYIIVYVGAISILFLFVIKMTQAGRSPKLLNKKENANSSIFDVNMGLILSLFKIKIYLIFRNYDQIEQGLIYMYYINNYSSTLYSKTDIELFGNFLYLGHPLIIVLIAILLWCILIGILRISQP